MKSKKATSITKQGVTLKDLKTRKNPKGGNVSPGSKIVAFYAPRSPTK